MAATLIADVFEARLFGDHVNEQTAEKSRLFTSGMVVTSDELTAAAQDRGRLIDLPFWQDLGGDEESDSDTVATTAEKITDDVEVARKLFWRKSYSVTDLATTIAGSDPLNSISERFVRFWVRAQQRRALVPMLQGLFDPDGPLGANATNPHIHDVAIEDGNAATSAELISATNVVEATTGTLGDAFDGLGIMMCHSQVYKNLQVQNLITFRQLSEQGRTVPTYLDFEVIVDDGCPAIAGATSGFKYTTFFAGQGSIAYGEGSPKVPAEVDRDAGVGAETVIQRRNFFLHPRGIQWTNSSVAGLTPTVAELQNDVNYSLVWEHKNVALAAMVTNG